MNFYPPWIEHFELGVSQNSGPPNTNPPHPQTKKKPKEKKKKVKSIKQ